MTVAAPCDWLEKKHTIFGKVEGETIYNLVKISELEVEAGSDRPVCDPLPRIERAIVIESFFDDIIPRALTKRLPEKQAANPEKKKTGFKAIKNRSLISFADEDDEED